MSIIISYYTKGKYEEVMNKYLLPSLKKYKLVYDIERIESLGSWSANTHYKATFIKKMMLKHKCPVSLIDADATIEKYPKLFDILEKDYPEIDIALHYLDWHKFWKRINGQDKREALSGTLYLNYNERVLQFLDEWIEENNRSNNLEQKNMENILAKWNNKLQIYSLPPEYCTIILRNKQLPLHYLNGKEPVILHHQISRKLKNVI